MPPAPGSHTKLGVNPKPGLRQRVITGLLLGGVAIASILLLPTPALALVMAVPTLFGAWEWAALTGIPRRWPRHWYLAFVAAVGLGCIWVTLIADELWPFIVSVCWWLSVVLLNSLYRPGWAKLPWHRWPLRVAGVITLAPAWAAIVLLHTLAPTWLLCFLLLTSTADIAAFFAGRYFGNTPLAPRLSPGKTREGLLAAVLACAALGLIWIAVADLAYEQWPWFVSLCIVAALASVEGDLFESLLKRHAGVKDSGGLLPGHGGVLDRIDSVTAAAPVFILGLMWMLP